MSQLRSGPRNALSVPGSSTTGTNDAAMGGEHVAWTDGNDPWLGAAVPQPTQEQQARERLHADGASGSDQAEVAITRSKLDEILDSFKNSLNEDIAETVADTVRTANTALEGKINISMATTVRALDARAQKRLDSIQAEVDDTNSRLAKQEADTVKLWAAVEKLNSGLAIAEKAVVDRSALDAEEFDRAPDLGIIRIGAPSLVARDAVRTALEPWLADAGLDDPKFQLTGPVVGQKFSIRVLGQAGLAAKLAQKALELLRLPDGSWREPAAVSPTGVQVRLYISEDKSPKQNKIEACGRRLLRAVKRVGITQSIHLNRKEGSISVDWKPLAKVQVHSKEEVSILWNALVVTELSIDKSAITTHFFEAGGSTAGVSWSS